MTDIILASTSKYRKALLERLNFPFKAHAPNVLEDEVKAQISDPRELAETLAMLKAQAVAKDYPNAMVIGGDQVACFKGEILGKPKTFENAFAQLKKFNGKTHELITSICIIYKNVHHNITDITKLTMRELTDKQIREYLQFDEPLDCAGSYKLEQMGISLFSKIESDDFTAIEGIPMIAVSDYILNKIEAPFWSGK